MTLLFSKGYRDSVTKFFASDYFHETSSPKPMKTTIGLFQIFSKISGDIRKSSYTTGVNYTGGKFATGVNKTVDYVAAGVNDTGDKLPLVSMTMAANLPPVYDYLNKSTLLLHIPHTTHKPTFMS
jgi:hypothetical protein